MIVISPGHWVIGSGARGIVDEVTESRKVVKEVSAILTRHKVGHKVVIDNVSKNANQNLTYLVREHAKYTVAKHISVHFNATAGIVGREIGCEVLYAHPSMKDKAQAMCDAICQASGLLNRGAKQRKDLRFLNAFPMSAILIEVCFVNSKKDVLLYEQHFLAICKAIAQMAKAL